MSHRTIHLFTLLVGTCILLIATAATALSAGIQPIQQASPPDNAPLNQESLEQFWQQMYPEPIGIAAHTNVYTYELLAKAQPDECFNGLFAPISFDLPDCGAGKPKVNEAYVWGMTDYSETIWFGTAPNVHCLVMGAFLSATIPLTTDSYTCQFGAGPYSTTLPSIIGDWRPPSLYVYDNEGDALSEVSPNGQNGYPFDPRFVSNTLGIRAAATFGDYVFFAGPAFTPTSSINIFLYNAADRSYRGAANLPAYSNIRKWINVNGVLYAAVGKGADGAVLRYTGNPADANPANRFLFEEVGALLEDGAEIALHDGRLFVNTWPSGLRGGDVAGLWMSPEIPDGGLTAAHLNQWVKVFAYDEYEPDALIARTYGGGALHSYQGDLYWGTMHVPFLATTAHLAFYEDDYIAASIPLPAAAISAALGSQRSVSIFKGKNFDTGTPEIEVVYGMPQLPAFDPSTLTWSLTDTLLGPPLYGLSGFNNMYNNYTWSMAEYDGQLFVGTMDWSYLVNDMFESLLNDFELPLDIVITLPDSVPGADLYRFFDSESPAIAESLTGVGNYTSYGIRNMLAREEGLYLGMANPMNLLTDLTDNKPEGGWELLRLSRHLISLTVGLEGNGIGTVESDPAGIACGGDCEGGFDFGSTVVLTPTASQTSTFEGWDGACNGTGICQVTLTESTHVTATFAKSRHPLVVNLVGGGSGLISSVPAGISCTQPSCSANFDIGTSVSLGAIAFSGSSFVSWGGACSGTNACQVAIGPGTTIVTATFEQNPQQVNLKISGEPVVGSQLSFTATLNLSPVDECTWDFGDGTIEECELDAAAAGVDAVHDVTIEATHTYTQAGVYIVIVTASNAAGTAVAAQQITIQMPTAEPPIQQPREIELFFPFVNRE